MSAVRAEGPPAHPCHPPRPPPPRPQGVCLVHRSGRPGRPLPRGRQQGLRAARLDDQHLPGLCGRRQALHLWGDAPVRAEVAFLCDRRRPLPYEHHQAGKRNQHLQNLDHRWAAAAAGCRCCARWGSGFRAATVDRPMCLPRRRRALGRTAVGAASWPAVDCGAPPFGSPRALVCRLARVPSFPPPRRVADNLGSATRLGLAYRNGTTNYVVTLALPLNTVLARTTGGYSNSEWGGPRSPAAAAEPRTLMHAVCAARQPATLPCRHPACTLPA